MQSILQQFQVAPIILAAEVFEVEKSLPATLHSSTNSDGPAHKHSSQEWTPADGLERNAWTWVANVLHAFSMALFLFAIMGLWAVCKGNAVGNFRLAATVASAGWLSLHLWPSLGMPAVVPGMEAAALGARQSWWLLSAVCAALACIALAFGERPWRVVVAALFLALPFFLGAPQHSGDALAGFSGAVHVQMEQLSQQLFWATTWLSLSFWSLLTLLGAAVFTLWLRPVLIAGQLKHAVESVAR
jgi:cobalt transporter subunit CbtA